MHQLKNFIKHFFTATRKGHNVHSPFVYQLCEEVFYNRAGFYDFERLNELRKNLLSDTTVLHIEDFGAGSKKFKTNKRKVKEIASSGISTATQSEIFYKLVNYLNSNTIVELGTSLGLNTQYLGLANKNGKVYSIEGSKELTDFSSNLIKSSRVENIELINGKFDDELPKLLARIPAVDLFYVDGNHTYDATIRYFNMMLDKRVESSAFIFDDIYWSRGMTNAWNEIKKHPDVTLSINAFYFGIVFFKKEIKEKVHLKIWL